MDTKLLKNNENDIKTAGEILRDGGLVAIPTETVYGLGANALNPDAVKNIFIAKGRPQDNPLIVHISEVDEIYPLVKDVPEKAKALMNAYWGGPLTIILPKSNLVPTEVSGGLDTVAIRMPKSETAKKIIKAAGVPIAAPSANTSGLPSPTTAKHVQDDMMGKIDAIFDGGECDYGVESTVITLATEVPRLLRPGGITLEMLEKVIGHIDVDKAVLSKLEDNTVAASPGMKYKHYSPRADIIILKGSFNDYADYVNSHRADGVYALCFDGEGEKLNVPSVAYGSKDNQLTQAHNLFYALRHLYELGAKTVYARCPEKNGVGMAVYNRLVRAAAFQVVDLKKDVIIGLTGGSGSGKSYVANIFEKNGFYIADCDKIAHEITQKNSPFIKILQENFGEDVACGGKLNRKLLAQRAFKDKKSQLLLNRLTHPEILKRAAESIENERKKGYTKFVIDAPLLFESEADKMCTKTLAVICPSDIRLQRIMARDNISSEQAEKRMSVQQTDDYYKSHADFIVINDNNADVNEQVNFIINNL